MKVVCTGYENLRVCVMCGGDLPKRRRVYCSDKCAALYGHLFFWESAKEDAIQRAGHKCQSCDALEKDIPRIISGWSDKSGLEVHHVVSLDGQDRTWHRLNMAWNLRVLCHACHVYEHSTEYRLQCHQEAMELVA